MARIVVWVLVLATRIASAEPASEPTNAEPGYGLGLVGSVEDSVVFPRGGTSGATRSVAHLGPSVAVELGRFLAGDHLVGHLGVSEFQVPDGGTMSTSDTLIAVDALALYEHRWSALAVGGGFGFGLLDDRGQLGSSLAPALEAHVHTSYDFADLEDAIASLRVDGKLLRGDGVAVAVASLGVSVR